MKITNGKSVIAKVMTIGLLAGAVVMATPAHAQRVRFGVSIGVPAPVRTGPVYVAPVYAAPAYAPAYVEPAYRYGWRRDEFARREAFRHDEWVRAHDYGRFHGFYGR
jgi:hypothetical protein